MEGLSSLGKGAEPEAVSRVVIDHILNDVCRHSGATLYLEERIGIGVVGDGGGHDFPTGVCDYVVRRTPRGRITAIVEAKRCLNGDMALLSSGAVQVALYCLLAQHEGNAERTCIGFVTDGRYWAALSPTPTCLALTPALDLVAPKTRSVLRSLLIEILDTPASSPR